MDVIVENINEVHIKITTDPSVKRELSDYFCFTVPNSQFHPKVLAGIWDGNIRLFNYSKQTLYKGLLYQLEIFCQQNQYQLIIGDDIDAKEQFSLIEAKEWVSSLNLPEHINVRDYQYESLIHCIRETRALLISATNSGKSLIQYFLTKYYCNHKTLIVVPTIALVYQMAEEFKKYGSVSNNYPSITTISGDEDKQWQEEISTQVTITTWQSIKKMPISWFDQFGVVIGDEAHLFTANSLTSILEKLVNCKYRFGVTGTLDGSKTHKLVLEGLFGKQKNIVTAKQLVEMGYAAEPLIRVLMLNYGNQSLGTVKQYKDEIDLFIQRSDRLLFIYNLARSLEGNTLILFRYVNHGNQIYDKLTEKAKEFDDLYFVDGTVCKKDRIELREKFKNHQHGLIVASYGTFSTGIDIPNIDNIIFAAPSKSRIKVLQSIGRGLRIKHGKTNINVFDIVDVFNVTQISKTGKHYTRVCSLAAHGKERIKFYIQEKFKYKTHKIRMKNV